jgi:hypothetical protein
MSPRDRIIEGVRKLLEQQYLESIGDQSKHEYARLSDSDKKVALKDFLQKLTDGSEADEWAKRAFP